MIRVNALAALSKCQNLRHLDLSWVSEELAAPNLSRSVKGLANLEYLALPRAGKISANGILGSISTTLQELHVNATILNDDLIDCSSTSRSLSLKRLEMQNCSEIDSSCFAFLLGHLPRLEVLKMRLNRSRTIGLTTDDSILSLDHVRHLQIPVDFIHWEFFEGRGIRSRENPCPIVAIELDYVQPILNPEWTIDSDTIWLAVTEGPFPHLRRVGLHRKLERGSNYGLSDSTEELSQLLKALAREDGEKASIPEDFAGVYIFGD